MLRRVETNSPVIPADIETAMLRPGWRDTVGWPVGLGEADHLCREQVGFALAWTQRLDDRMMRDLALLALPVILAYVRAIVLTALAMTRARRVSARIAGHAAELDYLMTGEGLLPVRSELVLAMSHIGLSYARRLARMRSWTPLSRMPRALAKPAAVAIGHNPLMRAAARKEHGAVGFRHAETILDAARRRETAPCDVTDVARGLADLLVEGAGLEEPFRARAVKLVEAVAQSHLGNAARDLGALRATSLPMNIWTGSGGLYAARAIGIEVLRRGGRVRRFDHGTPREFIATSETTSLLEFSVSSEFVLATEGAAEICRSEMAVHGSVADREVAILSGDGDPIFRRAPARRTKRTGGRLRVVYAPTQLLGFRQLVPALPPDPVHLDWQMRVAEFLKSLPVDFVCQAHPEGLFKNRPHPLEEVAPTQRGNFEAQLELADVFVFDYPATTALWEAACTDGRIVYLDMGAGRMTDPVARLFAERAIVLPIAHGNDHQLTFNEADLRDAVLSQQGPADPSAFRRLLAGAA